MDVQVRTSMELENHGEARVKMNDVELLSEFVIEQREHGGFVARCKWIARGSVAHWGHTHQRANGHSALITVQPVDGAWKISQLELNDQRRSVQESTASRLP